MLWILAVILLAVVLICLLRVRVTAEFKPSLLLILRIGPVSKQIYPSLKKEVQNSTEPKKAKKKDSKDGHKKLAKPKFSDICDAFEAMKPALVKALRRTRRGIRIYPLELSVIFGGREDPAGAAERFGYANAMVWSGMPVLEQLVKIPDPMIHLDINFEAESLRITGSVGIDIRIGTLLLLAIGIAIPSLRWLWKYSKENTTEKRQPAQASSV